jgi:hypothetical protein
MTTVFTVIGVKKLIYQTLQDDYGVLPNGGGSLGGGVVTGGLTQAQVEAIVNTAIANLPVSPTGPTQAQVDAAIAAAIATVAGGGLTPEQAALLGQVQPILDVFGGTVADLIAYVTGVDDNLGTLGSSAYATSVGLQQFLTAVAGNPDPSAITIAGGGLVALAVTAWDDLVAQVAGNNPADLQPLLDLLAVKPGATVADVAVIWQALSDGSVAVAQLLSVLSGKPLSQNPTAADVQAGLPVLIQAIVKDELGDRVTALEAAALSGEGVSQAVVDSLLARLDALEAENVTLKSELAKKISETDIAALREQAAFAVDETVRLEAQDAEIVAFVTEKYVDKAFFERWENSIVDLFSGVYTNHNELQKLVRDVMDAMNGPTATVQSITQMFWLLNDLLMALVDATGIDFPAGSK